MSHVVTAPYITLKVRDAAGALVVNEFYAGAIVPENADEADVKRLADKGMLAEQGSREADLLGAPAGTPVPGEPPNVPVQQEMLSTPSQGERLQRARDAADASDESRSTRTRRSASGPKSTDEAKG
ncbi:hypothetical protein [Micromonospora sp. NPDC023633]|uniref:hypothetical protein n=1 Tax=Micromonospora sp. NPDC023633 TaxID=3154320 RepID=UPI0033CA0F46